MGLFDDHVAGMLGSNSRIAKLIERVEAGESVSKDEIDRAVTLQSLDAVRAGELFALDQLQAEDVSDEHFRQWGHQQKPTVR